MANVAISVRQLKKKLIGMYKLDANSLCKKYGYNLVIGRENGKDHPYDKAVNNIRVIVSKNKIAKVILNQFQ